jgi:hypothetical protein
VGMKISSRQTWEQFFLFYDLFLPWWNRVRQVYEDVQNSITNGQFVIQFNLSALGLVLNNTTVLTEILVIFYRSINNNAIVLERL